MEEEIVLRKLEEKIRHVNRGSSINNITDGCFGYISRQRLDSDEALERSSTHFQYVLLNPNVFLEGSGEASTA